MGKVAPARPQGFDFRSGENDTGLDRFGDGKVVPSLPVVDFDRFQGA